MGYSIAESSGQTTQWTAADQEDADLGRVMREEVAASARGRRYFMEAMYNDGRTSLGFKGENSVSQTAFNGRVADGPITASEVFDANGLPSIPLKPSFDPEEFARFGRQIIRGLDADAVASGFQFQKVYATRFHLEEIGRAHV